MYDSRMSGLFFFIPDFFPPLHVSPLWILIAHLLQALLQMLAGLAWSNYQSQIPLASFPVTLLHGDGTRAGAEAETGAGAGAGLPGDRRQQAQEINTSTGALTEVQHLAPAGVEETKWMTGNDVTRRGGSREAVPLLVKPYLELTAGNHWFSLTRKASRWKHQSASFRVSLPNPDRFEIPVMWKR